MSAAACVILQALLFLLASFVGPDESPRQNSYAAIAGVGGCGGGGGCVDELVAQIAPIRVEHFGPGTWPITGPNKGGEPYYVIQDPVNFDVLAILDEDGEVVEQYSWEPYGTVLVCETHGSRPPPINKVGHHGLFFDRLDMPAVIGGYMNYPTFESGAFLLGHVRNRAYMPSIGRWAQRDPNATGQVLAAAMRGSRPNASPLGADLNILYGDGMSLYGYLRSAPSANVDPSGLFTTPELMINIAQAAAEELAEIGIRYVGEGIQSSLGALFGNYGEGQEEAFENVMDWSVPDDAFGPYTTAGGLSDRSTMPDGFASAVSDDGGPAMAGLFGPRGTAPLHKRGAAGERALRALTKGAPQGFKTPMGWRKVDSFKDGFAHESKQGYTRLTDFVRKQIDKDAYLISDKTFKGAHWHFYRSSFNKGSKGPDPDVVKYLNSKGIPHTVH